MYASLQVKDQTTVALKSAVGGNVVHFDTVTTGEAIEQDALYLVLASPSQKSDRVRLINIKDGVEIERDADRHVVICNAVLQIAV